MWHRRPTCQLRLPPPKRDADKLWVSWWPIQGTPWENRSRIPNGQFWLPIRGNFDLQMGDANIDKLGAGRPCDFSTFHIEASPKQNQIMKPLQASNKTISEGEPQIVNWNILPLSVRRALQGEHLGIANGGVLGPVFSAKFWLAGLFCG